MSEILCVSPKIFRTKSTFLEPDESIEKEDGRKKSKANTDANQKQIVDFFKKFNV
jgi:hypothetical protein